VTRVAIIFSMFGIAACAARPPSPTETTITPDLVWPGRYHFYVYGDPGLRMDPSIRQSNLPGYKQVQEGMRVYVASEFKARGLCPNGFTGPDVVLGPKATMERHFYVECVVKEK
jgi:hypothetical protein